jgi:hypothetical protein
LKSKGIIKIPPINIEKIEPIAKIDDKTILRGYQFDKETVKKYKEEIERENLEDLDFLQRLTHIPEDVPKEEKPTTNLEQQELFSFMLKNPYRDIPHEPNILNALLITPPIDSLEALARLIDSRPKEDIIPADSDKDKAVYKFWFQSYFKHVRN